jgi:hypothetical protein
MDAAVGSAAHTHAPHSKLEYLLALEHEAHVAATELALANMASSLTPSASAAALADGACSGESCGALCERSAEARCDPSPRALVGPTNANNGGPNDTDADAMLFASVVSHAAAMQHQQ